MAGMELGIFKLGEVGCGRGLGMASQAGRNGESRSFADPGRREKMPGHGSGPGARDSELQLAD